MVLQEKNRMTSAVPMRKLLSQEHDQIILSITERFGSMKETPKISPAHLDNPSNRHQQTMRTILF